MATASSEFDFEKATEKIAYEMYHFRRLARLYRDGKIGSGLWKQLVSQSLLLHLRIMWEFFYGTPLRNDVSVQHFMELDGFTFPSELRFRPAARNDTRVGLDTIKKALDQRLIHFGTGRWTGHHPGLEDYEQHFDELDCRITAFRIALPQHLLSVFDTRISQLEHRDKIASIPIDVGTPLKW